MNEDRHLLGPLSYSILKDGSGRERELSPHADGVGGYGSSEYRARAKSDDRFAFAMLAIVTLAMLCSVAWGIIKFIAVMKWMLT